MCANKRERVCSVTRGHRGTKWEFLSEAECLGLQESSRIPVIHSHRSSGISCKDTAGGLTTRLPQLLTSFASFGHLGR